MGSDLKGEKYDLSVKNLPEEDAPSDQAEAPVAEEGKPPGLRSLVNTPLKKVMLGVQFLSYVLIPGSPVIGALIGDWMGMETKGKAALILGIFIAGEVLFYGSLAFLGKGLLELLRAHFRYRFRRRKN